MRFLPIFRCCLPCKGTNFLANHNIRLLVWLCLWMLFTMQRYEFFSKSQLKWLNVLQLIRCCLPCKGTNFLANHNLWDRTKIKFGMLFTMQRYEFFSKSQHNDNRSGRHNGCCLPCKGTNFLANHNRVSFPLPCALDVVYHAKVRIF